MSKVPGWAKKIRPALMKTAVTHGYSIESAADRVCKSYDDLIEAKRLLQVCMRNMNNARLENEIAEFLLRIV
jgi:hypothetical protein